MYMLLNHPIELLLVTFVLLWAATRFGAALQVWHGPLDHERRADYDIVLGASLTLLSLLVGFSFSMASSRYDQRKNFEEGEANAIGTSYTRAELLPSADAAKVQKLLRDYVELRVRFYTTVNSAQVLELRNATRTAQSQLWRTAAAAARAAPSANSALVASSINDTLNAQGYAQAAAWNRIPIGAWVLLYVLGAIAAAMIGYRFQFERRQYLLMLILPAIMATAFFLIADIDCPAGGVIRILPENLLALMPSLT